MIEKLKGYSSTLKGKIFLALCSIVFICFCCFCGSSGLSSQPQSTQNSQSTKISSTLATPSTTPQPTNTLIPIATETPTATIPPAIQTQQMQATITAQIAEYKKIDPRELVTYADNHLGEKVVITGKIFNINGDTELQIFVGDSLDAVYVQMLEPFTGIYKDDTIKVYGVVAGNNCGTNSFGGKVCQPLLIDSFFEKQ